MPADPAVGVATMQPIPAYKRIEALAPVRELYSARLVRSGDLPAIKVGGRGQWRVETVELEAYIQRMYAETRELVSTRSDVTEQDEHRP